MSPASRCLALVALAFLGACTEPGPTVQGTGPLPSGPCGRAVVVVHTDYQSTAVSVVGWDGAVLADPLATSAELGLSGDDARDMRELFKQGYRGSRFSFGDPACPNLADQEQLLDLLGAQRLGITLSDEFQLEPEQSTSALVCHHPSAKYFTI